MTRRRAQLRRSPVAHHPHEMEEKRGLPRPTLSTPIDTLTPGDSAQYRLVCGSYIQAGNAHHLN
ncbi:MAG: hypothetical protein ACYDDO_11235 [Acidiferrobacterales bacterium]